jgi:hypothetical protein
VFWVNELAVVFTTPTLPPGRPGNWILAIIVSYARFVNFASPFLVVNAHRMRMLL